MARSNKRLQGIGGWLLAYVIVLSIGVVISLIALFWQRAWIQNDTFGYIFSWVLPNFLFSICIIILIFSREKRSVNWIIGFVWANLVFLSIGFLGLIEGILPATPHPLSTYLWMLAGVAAAIGTTFYFKKSERVKNTFVKVKK